MKEILLESINTHITEHRLFIEETKLFEVSYENFFANSYDVAFKSKEIRDRIHQFPSIFRYLGELLFENTERYNFDDCKVEKKALENLQFKYGISKESLNKYAQKRKTFGRLKVVDVFNGGNILKEVSTYIYECVLLPNPLSGKVNTHLELSDNSYRIIFKKWDGDAEEVAAAYRKLHLHAFWRYVLDENVFNTPK